MIWRGLVVGLDMFMWNSTSWRKRRGNSANVSFFCAP
jgi:hypothetical protein